MLYYLLFLFFAKVIAVNNFFDLHDAKIKKREMEVSTCTLLRTRSDNTDNKVILSLLCPSDR